VRHPGPRFKENGQNNGEKEEREKGGKTVGKGGRGREQESPTH